MGDQRGTGHLSAGKTAEGKGTKGKSVSHAREIGRIDQNRPGRSSLPHI